MPFIETASYLQIMQGLQISLFNTTLLHKVRLWHRALNHL
ncbi:hypothetical protein HMPREF0281_02599 [Corynebacterium ammoniagenes DSM 20306]|uniref:Uncharacterized protein n=1 Tax=Corynebacterium ammoniagenes DSM 20306 TaxID=649754 RepID=A0ABN0ACX5_CORAM|nr:hypothetical protein HMPREF0281_02599 [Corynebacterium ammoniagenes DSM 20306]